MRVTTSPSVSKDTDTSPERGGKAAALKQQTFLALRHASLLREVARSAGGSWGAGERSETERSLPIMSHIARRFVRRTTSSDLASLGHLPLKGKAIVGNAGCRPLQGKVAEGRMRYLYRLRRREPVRWQIRRVNVPSQRLFLFPIPSQIPVYKGRT